VGRAGGAPLRRPAADIDSPQVHLVGDESLYEVDALAVARPDREVAVNAGRCGVDLMTTAGLVGLHDVKRIAGRGRVIDDARSIRRPVQLRDALDVTTQLTAHDGHGPAVIDHAAGGVGCLGPDPHLRPVGRKLQHPNRGVVQLRDLAVGEVLEIASADLTQPYVPGTIAVGDERDQTPVRGNCGVLFRADEIGDARELRPRERVPPGQPRLLCVPECRAAEHSDDD